MDFCQPAPQGSNLGYLRQRGEINRSDVIGTFPLEFLAGIVPPRRAAWRDYLLLHWVA